MMLNIDQRCCLKIIFESFVREKNCIKYKHFCFVTMIITNISHFKFSASLDSYTIIQTFEHNESNLSALPSKWVNKKGWNGGTPDRMSMIAGNDLCYWPKGASGYRLLEQAKLDPTIAIDKRFLSAFRCKILKENIPTYVEVRFSFHYFNEEVV